jgi:hypothetical protein
MRQDQKYIEMLERYLDRVKNNTLSTEDRINLLEFYVNDSNTLANEKEDEMNKHTSILKYVTLAWYISTIVHQPD